MENVTSNPNKATPVLQDIEIKQLKGENYPWKHARVNKKDIIRNGEDYDGDQLF